MVTYIYSTKVLLPMQLKGLKGFIQSLHEGAIMQGKLLFLFWSWLFPFPVFGCLIISACVSFFHFLPSFPQIFSCPGLLDTHLCDWAVLPIFNHNIGHSCLQNCRWLLGFSHLCFGHHQCFQGGRASTFFLACKHVSQLQVELVASILKQPEELNEDILCHVQPRYAHLRCKSIMYMQSLQTSVQVPVLSVCRRRAQLSNS